MVEPAGHRAVRAPRGLSPAGVSGSVLRVAAAVAALALGAAGVFTSARWSDAASGGTHAAGHLGLEALPASAWGSVSAGLGRDDAAYRVKGLSARNPSQHLSLRFTAAGVVIGSGGATARLGLPGIGRAGSLAGTRRTAPRANGNRVSYGQGSVREWYVNGPLGLEQGFDVLRRPAGRGAVRLNVGLSGARARLTGHGGAVLTLAGGAALRYGKLSAVDARGRVLPARLALTTGGLSIVVDDHGAAYPIKVDPFIQQGSKLVGTGSIGPSTAGQGYSVALSADGNTALVGGPDDNNNAGAAWVFTRADDGSWAQQGQKLVGKDADNNPNGASQGNSVALSADGNTALIGGPDDNGDTGAAWVFTRAADGSWSQQGQKLVGKDADGTPASAEQGYAVALSADGNTALIGGWDDNSGAGAAWVFTRAADGSWSQQGQKLVGKDADGTTPADAEQGSSVALSADGNTALLGGPGDNSFAGATWVFTRSSDGTWTQQGNKLVGSGAVNTPFLSGEQGYSVALAADGNTALIGGPDDNDFAGAAWIFTRTGGAWTQHGPKLVGSDAIGDANQGTSVALSGDGNTALTGGAGDNDGRGAAWVFEKAPTSTSLSSSQDPSAAGETVSFTATVSTAVTGAGTPTGTVTFLDDGTQIGTAPLASGQASFTTSALTPGDDTITASYSGDGEFAGSTRSSTQTVNAGPPAGPVVPVVPATQPVTAPAQPEVVPASTPVTISAITISQVKLTGATITWCKRCTYPNTRLTFNLSASADIHLNLMAKATHGHWKQVAAATLHGHKGHNSFRVGGRWHGQLVPHRTMHILVHIQQGTNWALVKTLTLTVHSPYTTRVLNRH